MSPCLAFGAAGGPDSHNNLCRRRAPPSPLNLKSVRSRRSSYLAPLKLFKLTLLIGDGVQHEAAALHGSPIGIHEVFRRLVGGRLAIALPEMHLLRPGCRPTTHAHHCSDRGRGSAGRVGLQATRPSRPADQGLRRTRLKTRGKQQMKANETQENLSRSS